MLLEDLAPSARTARPSRRCSTRSVSRGDSPLWNGSKNAVSRFVHAELNLTSAKGKSGGWITERRAFNDRHVASDKAIGDVVAIDPARGKLFRVVRHSARETSHRSRGQSSRSFSRSFARLKICRRSAARLTSANISRLTPCPRN